MDIAVIIETGSNENRTINKFGMTSAVNNNMEIHGKE